MRTAAETGGNKEVESKHSKYRKKNVQKQIKLRIEEGFLFYFFS